LAHSGGVNLDYTSAGLRLEQGDTGDGRISREAVALAAAAAALFRPAASR
jgi:hypothetical protein